jgi:hypothetical protein
MHLGQAHGPAWTTEAGQDGGGNVRSREVGQQSEPKVAMSGYKASAYWKCGSNIKIGAAAVAHSNALKVTAVAAATALTSEQSRRTNFFFLERSSHRRGASTHHVGGSHLQGGMY